MAKGDREFGTCIAEGGSVVAQNWQICFHSQERNFVESSAIQHFKRSYQVGMPSVTAVTWSPFLTRGRQYSTSESFSASCNCEEHLHGISSNHIINEVKGLEHHREQPDTKRLIYPLLYWIVETSFRMNYYGLLALSKDS